MVADSVKKSGAVILRGGAFKPRTSPYAFQGLGKEGLDYLESAKEAVNIPIISEVMNTDIGWLFRGECQHSVHSRGKIGCILQGT